MPFPYLLIPRTVYDDGRRDLERANERIKELEQLLLDLKLDGAQIVAYNPEFRRAKREKDRQVDVIDEAIASHPKCQRFPALARKWRAWADRLIEARGDTPEVRAFAVQRIRTWDQITGVEDDDEDDADRKMGLIA